MITPTAEHLAVLNSRVFWAVDLYQFAFIDGTFLRFAGDTGRSTTWNGQLFSGNGPIITRDSIRVSRGLSVDNLNMVVDPKDDDLLLGIPWRAAVINGALSGAEVSIWRAHASMPGAPIAGAVLRFRGPVVDYEVEDEIRITVASEMTALDAMFPLSVYSPGCDRVLYAPGCDVSRAEYQTSAALQAGSTASALTTPLTAPAGYYNGGELRFVSGSNAGARRTVKRHTEGGGLVLTYPLTHAPVAGDAFVIWPGCARDIDDCENKFNNNNGSGRRRFRGQPWIPSPETAL